MLASAVAANHHRSCGYEAANHRSCGHRSCGSETAAIVITVAISRAGAVTQNQGSCGAEETATIDFTLATCTLFVRGEEAYPASERSAAEATCQGTCFRLLEQWRRASMPQWRNACQGFS